MSIRLSTLLKASWFNWKKDNAPRIGAALAYYAVFSIAPIILILIGISRLIFEQETARTQLLFQLEKVLGPAGSQVADIILDNAAQLTAKGGTITTIIAGIIILVGATAIFRQMKGAMDTIWSSQAKQKHGSVRAFVFKNVLALLMLIGTGLLLISSFLITTIINIIITSAPGNLGSPMLVEVINNLVSLIIIAFVFIVTLKLLASIKLKILQILPGAFIASLLFLLGRLAFGFYLAYSNLGTTYGAVGAFVVFLFWLYYSAQIFLFGVEFTKVFALARK